MQIKPLQPGSPAAAQPGARVANDSTRFENLLANRLEQGETATPQPAEWVSLGTISARRPTVSHLLIGHPQYGRDCWSIIHSDANQEKRFDRLQAGTPIWLNPETLEISWGAREKPSPVNTAADTAAAPAAQDSLKTTASPTASPESGFSSGLAQAVRPYIGRPYTELNCYDLVVRGLEKMGIRYQGAGGLKAKLLEMALASGRPANTYLNGEGLIRASGETVYTASLNTIQRPAETAEEIYAAMASRLDAGQLLSFSTPTRGHTGVISSHKDEWTFINSGRVDNPVVAAGTAKGVSEEALKAEIDNWVQLAHRRREPLQITLGRFQDRKLTRFRGNTAAAVRTG